MENERKAFETWFIENGNKYTFSKVDMTRLQDKGRYKFFQTEVAWQAWKARAMQAKVMPQGIARR